MLSFATITMKTHLLFFVFMFLASYSVSASQDSKIENFRKCIKCLCYARTLCYSLHNCARYSISYDYWKKAQYPLVDVNDDPNDESSYKKCIQDENCIVDAIVQYADVIGHMDCNCDGKFDCKDRLAIHLYGANCTRLKFGNMYAKRFNTCAKDLDVDKILEQEDDEECVAKTLL